MENADASAQNALRRLGSFAKKKLSQNFLQHQPDLEAIAASLNLKEGDTVLEIGPGLGALTAELLKTGASVIAIEKDRPMVNHLAQHFPSPQLRVLEADILTVQLSKELSPVLPIKVAGNIPYNITTPILFWFLEQAPLVTEAVFTVQKELAERLCASPGGKTWGAVSVMVQSQADIKIIRTIPRGHFYPVPNVDSAVVHLQILDKPQFAPADRETFSFWVARAFQKRRKMLPNAIEVADTDWNKEKISQVLAKLGIDAKRRPETLSIQEWASVASCLGKPHPS